MELGALRGVGAARRRALEKAGIATLADLLQTLPVDYRDTQNPVPIGSLREGESAAVCGCLKGKPRLARFRGMTSVTATLQDETGALRLVWFNQPWVEKQLPAREELLLYGKAETRGGHLQMNSPTRETRRALIPVYRPLPGVPGKVLRDLVAQALCELERCCPETLPESLRLRHRLCERNFALRQAHFPQSRELLAIARRRMAFEELLLYQAAMSLMRGAGERGVRVLCQARWQADFWRALPFAPTGAQSRVLAQIAKDLAADAPMARMVQGDVGSGKTALALGALYLTARAGHQGALMAPTEILARQHLESARRLLAPLGVSCGLLLGGMRAAERRDALAQISSGAWQVVIGTHALISQDVAYRDLALVVTDEQHRFGVRQRTLLARKAGERSPNVLVMSATPIPRTLALILYGDLELSVVDELPPGRTPVHTRIVPEEKREGLYGFLRAQAAAGRQAYIVCPLVEDSELAGGEARSAQAVYAELSQGPLSSLRLGLAHGQQPAAQRAAALEAFSRGEIDVLVATTVVEVGVNVPNATVMVIENADRYGLSQLHQLRGRVGRGAAESWCFLLAQPNDRLRALCETNDGFAIAREDLAQRGPGELLGTRQHGAPLGLAAAGADAALIEETQSCMLALRRDGALAQERRQVEAAARERFSRVLEAASRS